MNLKQQYQSLEAKKVWRIFKVLYWILAVLLFVAAIFALISFINEVGQPYSSSDGVRTGIIIVLSSGIIPFILFWVIKRLVAYMTYGKTEK